MATVPAAITDTVTGMWNGGFRGAGQLVVQDHEISIAAPVVVGGSGDGVSPSLLLVGAAGGCYLLTLAAILQRYHFSDLHIEIQCSATHTDGLPPELLQIVHRPTIMLSPAQAGRVKQARRCFEVAKDACVATRALANVDISVDGTVLVGPENSALSNDEN